MTQTLPSLLRPGENCWRRVRTERLKLLVDGESYFGALAKTLARARHSITIVGWDVDSRMRLTPDGPPLGELLDGLVRQQRGLEVRILAWDPAIVYAFERDPTPTVSFGWRTHHRMKFLLDDDHPPAAAHHQKIVVVDGAVAFLGGLDLAIRRWDTSAHPAQLATRVDPSGEPYDPFHDVQVMVDGEAAAALGELVRERWRRAAGRWAQHPVASADPWPPELTPDLTGVEVGLARTEPEWDGRPAVREVERLYLDLIAAAREAIYIESQYFTSSRIGEALAARLAEPDGPDLVVVQPNNCSGWLERSTMGVFRERVFNQLREADHHDRLRIFWPAIPTEGEHKVNVHSKVMIVDDRFFRVGSSNLSNRSMGVDTECDLLLESRDDPRIAEVIAGYRARLLGEHLGVGTEPAAAALRAQRLVAAVDGLVRPEGHRTLLPLPCDQTPAWTEKLLPAEGAFIDPAEPIDADRLLEEHLPWAEVKHGGGALLKVAVVLLVLAGLAAAWRWTPLRDWIHLDRIVGFAQTFQGEPTAILVVVGAYVAGSLMVLPVNLLNLATVLGFGLWPGIPYALAGCLVGAAVTYGLGRALGRFTLRQVVGSRVNRLASWLSERGVLTIALARMIPMAPFTLVNMVGGAVRIPAVRFIGGTLLGMLPGLLAFGLLGDQLGAAVREPTAGRVAVIAALVVLLAGGGAWLQRALRRRREEHARA